MFVVLRSLMLVGCTIAGAIVAAMLKFDAQAQHFPGTDAPLVIVIGALAGLLLAIVAILCELFLRRISLRDLAVIVVGLVLGTMIAWLITYCRVLLPDYIKEFINAKPQHTYFFVSTLALYVLFVYIGIVVAVRGKAEFSLFLPQFKYNREKGMRPLVIDTSAIIDGRVTEVYKTGFMRNKIIVPEFVLHELQLVSDSQVPLTRAKGRRGLDTLKHLQDAPNIDVEVTNIDFPDVREVDDKLMKLAKEIDATILTTDYNLQQVARIQQIPCLNIYGLVNALKAPFIPGEKISLQIVKEGSETNQGIGFLDDGTMIVVSNARPFIGKRADIELVSMIQGASGRIFFADVAKNDKKPATATTERAYHDRPSRGQERRRA